MFDFVPVDVNEEIEKIDENIRLLQERAALLRRVGRIPPAEKLTELYERFAQVHGEFCSALDAFGNGSASVFEELAVILGYQIGDDFNYWISVRGDLGRFFRIAQCISEEFYEDTRRGLYHEVRKELETLFTEMGESDAPRESFEDLLRRNGQIEYDEKFSESPVSTCGIHLSAPSA